MPFLLDKTSLFIATIAQLLRKWLYQLVIGKTNSLFINHKPEFIVSDYSIDFSRYSTNCIPCKIELLTLLPWHPWSSRQVDRALQQLDFSPDPPRKNVRSIGIEPPCRFCGCRRGYLHLEKLLCCRCDREIGGDRHE